MNTDVDYDCNLVNEYKAGAPCLRYSGVYTEYGVEC